MSEFGASDDNFSIKVNKNGGMNVNELVSMELSSREFLRVEEEFFVNESKSVKVDMVFGIKRRNNIMYFEIERL